MEMTFKKEVKHSVVYETADEKAAVKSVYVMKDWLSEQEETAKARAVGSWPKEIDLEIKVSV